MTETIRKQLEHELTVERNKEAPNIDTIKRLKDRLSATWRAESKARIEQRLENYYM